MKTKTNVKSGGPGLLLQHNQTIATIKVQTGIKAGSDEQKKRSIHIYTARPGAAE